MTKNSDAGRQSMARRALQFATQAHRRIDQRRKYSRQPYEVHLRAVADIVASVTDDPEMIAAAWLHDSVEDTPATLEDIGREFGTGVAALVSDQVWMLNLEQQFDQALKLINSYLPADAADAPPERWPLLLDRARTRYHQAGFPATGDALDQVVADLELFFKLFDPEPKAGVHFSHYSEASVMLGLLFSKIERLLEKKREGTL